jgi:hypothetical protein
MSEQFIDESYIDMMVTCNVSRTTVVGKLSHWRDVTFLQRLVLASLGLLTGQLLTIMLKGCSRFLQYRMYPQIQSIDGHKAYIQAIYKNVCVVLWTALAVR